MLVLSRKVNQSILIEGGIRITVTSVNPRQVRLAIEAPPEVAVFRQELVAQRAPGKLLSRRWSWRLPVMDSEEGPGNDSSHRTSRAARYVCLTAEQVGAGSPSLVLEAEVAG